MNLRETRQEFSLTDYLEGTSALLKEIGMGKVWVKAEISSLHVRPKGYWSLSLTDDVKGKKTANVSALIWGTDAPRIMGKFQASTGKKLAVGMRVLIRVSIQLSPLWGFSLVIDDIDPLTTEDQVKLLEIRSKLKSIWHQNKTLKTPVDFTRVAVLAPNGAGIEDFLKEAMVFQHYGVCTFHVILATFEGPNASKSITDAMREIEKLHIENPFDAIAIVRGGGASSSLDWLNDTLIIQAICKASIPVLVGVGHERDLNLIDEVANVSLGTPSKLIAYIGGLIVAHARQAETDFLSVRSILDIKLERLETHLDKLKLNGQISADGILLRASSQVDDLMREGIGLGPYSTMQRGYAVVTDMTGKVVTSISEVEETDILRVSFQNGSLLVKNLGEEKYE